MNLKEIVEDMETQLAWRGPGGKEQGHFVMPRSEAKELLGYIILMREGLKQLSDPLLIPRTEEVGIARALKLISTMRQIAWSTLVAVDSNGATPGSGTTAGSVSRADNSTPAEPADATTTEPKTAVDDKAP